MVVLYYFDWEDYPFEMHLFANEADAEEFLLAVWEEDEYNAFLRALYCANEKCTIEEILGEKMYDYLEEDMDCWRIQRVEHSFI